MSTPVDGFRMNWFRWSRADSCRLAPQGRGRRCVRSTHGTHRTWSFLPARSDCKGHGASEGQRSSPVRRGGRPANRDARACRFLREPVLARQYEECQEDGLQTDDRCQKTERKGVERLPGKRQHATVEKEPPAEPDRVRRNRPFIARTTRDQIADAGNCRPLRACALLEPGDGAEILVRWIGVLPRAEPTTRLRIH